MIILFTCIGRRVELIQAFRKAADECEIDLTIIGTDITENAPALYFCDVQKKVCPIKDTHYISQVLTICKQEKVDCLIPTIDTDLLLLAKNKNSFEEIGTKILINEIDKILICQDKNKTADYFVSVGLKTPITVNSIEEYTEGFPAFIKQKDGSSSINAYQADNIDNLKSYAESIKDYIIQPFVSGREYTIDILCDFDGNPIYITPRERLEVRAGEVLKTRITQDTQMIEEILKLIQEFKPCGPITVQLIREEKTGDDYYIEINPRFGGGVPLSMKAGADSAKAVLRILNGDKLSYIEKAAGDGALYSRFDQSICLLNRNSYNRNIIKGVIFDLDDTLYPEKDYIKSGFQAVAEYLGDVSYTDRLWKNYIDKRPAIDSLLKELHREHEISKCLEIYRWHKPTISLYCGVTEIIQSLRLSGIKIGVITDGRPEGQRNKIETLGLEKLVDDIIITDELGGIQFRKPCDIAFQMMKLRWKLPYKQMVYIGDNPKKDFIAPDKLGMQSILFKNLDGIYNQPMISDIPRVVVQDILDIAREVLI